MTELLAGGLALVSSLIQVVIVLLNIIGLFKIYQKMGKPGWKGIIPFYNMYGLYDELWDKKYFWGYLLAQVVMLNPSSPSGLLFSVADLDALKAVSIPAVEVHISDVDAREPFRQISYAGLACKHTIKGQGFDGYRQAMVWLKEHYGNP